MLSSLTIDSALRWGQLRLQGAGFGGSDAYREVRYLLARVMGCDRSYLVGFGEAVLSSEQADRYCEDLGYVVEGIPFSYIIGEKEFYGLDFACGDGVLIPRGDSEVLVDVARRYIADRGAVRVLDMGCGTGALGVSLAWHADNIVSLDLVDISDSALSLAGANAQKHLAERAVCFNLCNSDWFANIAGSYDIILCNPPYICVEDWFYLPSSVRDYESWRSLCGGEDGLLCYELLSVGVSEHLDLGGLLFLEIGVGQRCAVVELFEAVGFCLLDVVEDLGGIERVLVFRLG